MPIRIRSNTSVTTDTVSILVENNKFIESFVDNGGVYEFCRDNYGNKIYIIGRNYYQVNGEALTNITSANFQDTAASIDKPYEKEDEVPTQK